MRDALSQKAISSNRNGTQTQMSRRVSGLEAFSRYPTRESFTALACRPTVFTQSVR